MTNKTKTPKLFIVKLNESNALIFYTKKEMIDYINQDLKNECQFPEFNEIETYIETTDYQICNFTKHCTINVE